MTSEPIRLTETIEQGITYRLNQLGDQAGCRPLSWLLRPMTGSTLILDGFASRSYAEGEVAGVLAPWVSLLGLIPAERKSIGTVKYTGEVDGWGVVVWGVIDRAAFDRRATELRAGGER